MVTDFKYFILVSLWRNQIFWCFWRHRNGKISPFSAFQWGETKIGFTTVFTLIMHRVFIYNKRSSSHHINFHSPPTSVTFSPPNSCFPTCYPINELFLASTGEKSESQIAGWTFQIPTLELKSIEIKERLSFNSEKVRRLQDMMYFKAGEDFNWNRAFSELSAWFYGLLRKRNVLHKR